MLVACSPEPPAEEARATTVPSPVDTPAPDAHSSRHSLDWAGTYEGFLPCAGCPAMFVRLTLTADGGFDRRTRALPVGAADRADSGRFEWLPDGGSIVLDATGDNWRLRVGEGRLILLGDDGSPAAAQPPLGELGFHDASVTAPDLARWLHDHRWTLRAATGVDGQQIDALFPPAAAAFAMAFEDNRIRFDGGCNGLSGGIRIEDEERLRIQGPATTLMACEPALMAADAALADVLAGPLRAVAARGSAPALALVADAGQVLLFTGTPTHAARYGAATIVFLEVAAQKAPCDPAAAAGGECLQVRTIEFDPQGLRVGTPGAFASFPHTIEGFEHQAGIRNVLRIRKFPSPEGFGEGIHVLDLVVESEVVDR
jgi:heat shock protein HslJ